MEKLKISLFFPCQNNEWFEKQRWMNWKNVVKKRKKNATNVFAVAFKKWITLFDVYNRCIIAQKKMGSAFNSKVNNELSPGVFVEEMYSILTQPLLNGCWLLLLNSITFVRCWCGKPYYTLWHLHAILLYTLTRNNLIRCKFSRLNPICVNYIVV